MERRLGTFGVPSEQVEGKKKGENARSRKTDLSAEEECRSKLKRGSPDLRNPTSKDGKERNNSLENTDVVGKSDTVQSTKPGNNEKSTVRSANERGREGRGRRETSYQTVGGLWGKKPKEANSGSQDPGATKKGSARVKWTT